MSPKTAKYTSDATAVAMRMGEIYLIAAEAEFYLNGATTVAANYINVLRNRVSGQYFVDGVHGVRPIPQGQIDAITNPAGFQNAGY